MKSLFHENLKKLAEQYTQKEIAEKTGVSQSSINNYLTKESEPSIQFLIALKRAFGINVDQFLFSVYNNEKEIGYDRFIGNYIMYYYNNDSYKGEVHINLKNTLNYGVMNIFKDGNSGQVGVRVYTTKDKTLATRLLQRCNSCLNNEELTAIVDEWEYIYEGGISANDQSIFINFSNEERKDQAYLILNNPPFKDVYKGGIGTLNSIARGREHNPCIQFMILSRKVLDVPDGELYESLKFDDYNVNMGDNIRDIIDLFKRLYVEKNEISRELTESQKQAVIKNKLEYHFNEILEANVFRFAKISNKEDDMVYRLIKEGLDV